MILTIFLAFNYDGNYSYKSGYRLIELIWIVIFDENDFIEKLLISMDFKIDLECLDYKDKQSYVLIMSGNQLM